MDPRRTVLVADVRIRADGRIAALAPPSDNAAARRSIDASGMLVVPGLVQAHVHLCQTLFRGLAENRPLLSWLRERVWPLEAAHDPDSLRASFVYLHSDGSPATTVDVPLTPEAIDAARAELASSIRRTVRSSRCG